MNNPVVLDLKRGPYILVFDVWETARLLSVDVVYIMLVISCVSIGNNTSLWKYPQQNGGLVKKWNETTRINIYDFLSVALYVAQGQEPIYKYK